MEQPLRTHSASFQHPLSTHCSQVAVSKESADKYGRKEIGSSVWQTPEIRWKKNRHAVRRGGMRELVTTWLRDDVTTKVRNSKLNQSPPNFLSVCYPSQTSRAFLLIQGILPTCRFSSIYPKQSLMYFVIGGWSVDTQPRNRCEFCSVGIKEIF